MKLQPQDEYLFDAYRFTYVEEGIEVVLERFKEEKTSISVEMTTYCILPGNEGLLHQGRFSLNASQSRSTYVKALERRARPGFLDAVDFQAVIEQVCYRSQQRWREGEPLIDLAAVDYRQRATYLIRPYLLDQSPTVLFGYGGLGKSMIGLAFGVCVACGTPVMGGTPVRSGNVIYLDWEWDKEIHAARLEAICAGLGVPIPEGKVFYRRQYARLIDSAAAIRRLVNEVRAVLVIVDSMGMARGGDPDSAGDTIDAFNSMRTFGCAVLVLDHMAKNTEKKNNPFGSVYTTNGARLMWRLDGVHIEGTNRSNLSLTNTKANGRYEATRGFEMNVDVDDDDLPERVVFKVKDVRDMPELRPTLANKAKIMLVMRESRRPLTVNEIKGILEEGGTPVAYDVIKTELNNGRGETFTIVPDSSTKANKWALLSREEEPPF